jgi:hypothetical protein
MNIFTSLEIDAFDGDLKVNIFSLYLKSFSEFAVSTRVLRNKTLATRSYHFDDFKVLRGSREIPS